MAEIITREEIAMWRGHLLGLLPHQTFAMPRATLDIILDAAEASLSHPAALEAECEALRAECARKDEALRQIAEPRNWEEQDRARSIARAALGPWRPTHREAEGTLFRKRLEVDSPFGVLVIFDNEDGALRALLRSEWLAIYPGPGTSQIARTRPLTPAEQAAYVEAAMGERT